MGVIKEENTSSIPIGNSKNQSKGNDSNIKLNAIDIGEEKNNNSVKNISYYYNESSIMNINVLKQNIPKNNNLTINDILDDIIIKNILLFLDIKSVCPFSLVNK